VSDRGKENTQRKKVVSSQKGKNSFEENDQAQEHTPSMRLPSRIVTRKKSLLAAKTTTKISIFPTSRLAHTIFLVLCCTTTHRGICTDILFVRACRSSTKNKTTTNHVR